MSLDYGREGLEVEVPDHSQVLEMGQSPGLERVSERIEGALSHPIGTPSLARLASGKRDACIVISDITRPVPNPIILPPVLRILEGAGISRDRITILIGTGLHRPNTGDELVELVGPQIAADYCIVNHVARDRATLRYLGETSLGMPIWIDKAFASADLKIATSLIEPHLMAGYSGGRKAICPGIMGVDTIRAFHSPQILSHPRAAEGFIEGNPVHRQALEAAQRSGVDFTVNVTMNDSRRITGVFCGDLEKAHGEGVSYLEERACAYVDEPVDIVITSGAGFPLDLTFYQSVKGMTAALPIVRDGGTILMAARCDEGIGSMEFGDLVTSAQSAAEFEHRLEDPDFFVIDQWQVQELCKVVNKVEVGMYSEGMREFAQTLSLVDIIPSLAAGVEKALQRYGPAASVAVIPRGPYLLCRVRGTAP